MNLEHLPGLVIAVVGALPNLIIGIAILVRVLKSDGHIIRTGQAVNGRLDQLLRETERRVRAEFDLQLDAIRSSVSAEVSQVLRPQPLVVDVTDERHAPETAIKEPGLQNLGLPIGPRPFSQGRGDPR